MSLLRAPTCNPEILATPIAAAPARSPAHFRCSKCGNCCRELFVAVTHRDLSRLQESTRTAASQMVSWLAPGSVELAAAAGQFLRTADGLRLMVLEHQAGACRFLLHDSRCAVHESRPLDCRQFPLHVTHRGEVEFLTAAPPMPALKLRVLGDVECEAEFGEDSGLEQALAIESDRAREVREFSQLVAEWNRRSRWLLRLRNKTPDLRELFSFLGLE